MEKFKLNEEQKHLMKKLSDDANGLIQKYSCMKNTFDVTISKVKAKMNYCNDESIKEVKEEIEALQKHTTYVIEKLGKINHIANGYDGYTSAASLLLAVQSFISDVRYELGKLEGYSSGKVYTFMDAGTLIRNCEALKKSLLE